MGCGDLWDGGMYVAGGTPRVSPGTPSVFDLPGSNFGSGAKRCEGFLYSMDARVKLAAFLGLVVMTAFMNSMLSILGVLVGAVFLTGTVGSRWRSVLIRVAVGIPFGGLIVLTLPFVTAGSVVSEIQLGWFSLPVTLDGIQKAAVVGLRIVCCLWLMSLVLVTTDLITLMRALETLRVPRVITAIVEFGVRYMQLLSEEAVRMQRARRSRGFAPRNIWDKLAIQGWSSMVGNLFLRSVERSERVYWAMMSRGYTGTVLRFHEFPPLRLGDAIAGSFILVYGILWSVIARMF